MSQRKNAAAGLTALAWLTRIGGLASKIPKLLGGKLLGVKLMAIAASATAVSGGLLVWLGDSLVKLGEKISPQQSLTESATAAAGSATSSAAVVPAPSNRALLLMAGGGTAAMAVVLGIARRQRPSSEADRDRRVRRRESFQRIDIPAVTAAFETALRNHAPSEGAPSEDAGDAECSPASSPAATRAHKWSAAAAVAIAASAIANTTGKGTARRVVTRQSTRFLVAEIVFGRPEDAALGVLHFMCVTRNGLPLMDGVEAIVREVSAHGSDVDRECLDYVLRQPAGSCARTFPNCEHPRDCDADGVRTDRLTASGAAMKLADFVAHPRSRAAKLEAAHVLALRLYSTAAYRALNEPLRDLERFRKGEAHALPSTVAFLDQAIRQLRANEAPGAVEGEASTSGGGAMGGGTCRYLYRGLRDVSLCDEFERLGGSELGMMSTTSSLDVAMQYSASWSCVLLRLCTRSFMERGADISYLSAFPAENEVLYPPLTYLQPTGEVERVRASDGSTLTLVDVSPHFPS